MTSRSYLGL